MDALRDFGANTSDGLNRCMNNEAMYLRLVDMGLKDANFERLAEAVEADDRKAAFEAVHALKGVMGNLSLTPIYDPASEMTELLRAGKEGDLHGYLDQILQKRSELIALRDS